jgi:hypothetical protein
LANLPHLYERLTDERVVPASWTSPTSARRSLTPVPPRNLKTRMRDMRF